MAFQEPLKDSETKWWNKSIGVRKPISIKIKFPESASNFVRDVAGLIGIDVIFNTEKPSNDGEGE